MLKISINSLPLALFGLVIVGILAAFTATAMLPPQGPTATYGAADNGKTITVSEGSSFKIILDENPTTGYTWNATLTPGLAVSDSAYVQGGSHGVVGAGGTHEWTLKATGKGEQQFTAVYKRPWEQLTGNESSFALKINVE